MKIKILTLVTLCSILLISCTKDKLTASGDKITETRSPGQFSTVNTSGSNTVHIDYGTEFKVTLKGSNNLVPYFKTNVIGSTLYLGYENASVQHDDVEVFVTLPAIRKIAVSGSSKVTIQGTFPTINDFRLAISGSGEVTVQDAFNSDEVFVQLSGSGKADLSQISAKEAEVNISGSGNTRINVAEKLKARISGSGKIYYTGNAEVDADVSGSGKVIRF